MTKRVRISNGLKNRKTMRLIEIKHSQGHGWRSAVEHASHYTTEATAKPGNQRRLRMECKKMRRRATSVSALRE